MVNKIRRSVYLLAGLLLFTGLLALAVQPAPASAATTLTITISCDLDQKTLDNLVENIVHKYGFDPDEIIIRYPDGTTKQYTTGSQPPAAPSPQPQPVEPKPAPVPAPVNTGLVADEQKMVNLVNQERARAGLSPLKINIDLVKLARLKAQDMIKLNYFGHTSPTYGSPFDMMKSTGIAYRYAGENLAGAYSVDSVHTNLMNSPGHKANILNKNFKEIGIGIVDGGPYGKMFVQMFIG